MGSAVLLVPWQADFIAFLARELDELLAPDPAAGLIVFPHRRPARYLQRALAGQGRVRLLPEMLASEELLQRLHLRLHPGAGRLIGTLDRAALLLDMLAADAGLLAMGRRSRKALAPDRAQLFPWCRQLADVFEECLRMRRRPVDLDEVAAGLPPWAQAMLGRVSVLFDRYLGRLRAEGLVTPGLMAWNAAEQAERVAELLAGRPVLLAGFATLTGAEEAVHRSLWSAGMATVLWHSDPALAQGRAVHPAAEVHREMLASWGARASLVEVPQRAEASRVRFFEGFDLHSQLAELRRLLALEPELSDTAVVLPDAGSLAPVLHHLPERDINVSMGYPLARTALYDLLDTVLRLQETSRRDDGATGYFWRDLLALLRHPYLRMLELDGRRPLRLVFHTLELRIRRSGTYLAPLALDCSVPEELHEALDALDPAAVADFGRQVLAACLQAFEGLATLGQLAGALDQLVTLLKVRGGTQWQTHLLDAEVLQRLQGRILPELAGCRLSREPLPAAQLFALLRQCLEAERVAFEAEPLTGLQVLGFLETRLLSFKRLYVLEATEERLPGPVPADPLLPDGLRARIGLADDRQRDAVAAYTFHRLVQASEAAVLFTQTGIQPGGILDDRARRSRFVEQLLWAEEQRQGRRIRPGDGLLAVAAHGLGSIEQLGRPMPRTPAVHEKLAALLERPVSPSFLDSFLTCPLRFYFERLTPVRPLEEQNEDGDPGELGGLVHEVLREYLHPWQGRGLRRAELDPDALEALFLARLAGSALEASLAVDHRLALRRAGPLRLRRFVENFPEETELLGLELDCRAVFQTAAGDIQVAGRLDRLDRRDGAVVLLDYKTGTPRKPRPGVFETDRWEALPTGGFDAGALQAVAEAFVSLQLPLYLGLCRQALGHRADAAWVTLGDEGKEVNLFPKGLDPAGREAFVDHTVPQVLAFVVDQLRSCAEFTPRAGRHCAYCPYAGPCDAKKPFVG